MTGAHPRGPSLISLFPMAARVASFLPTEIVDLLTSLQVNNHSSRVAAGWITHDGTVSSVEELALPAVRDWPLRIPGLTDGIRFRLTISRILPTGVQNLEPLGGGWILDLFADDVAVQIPGLVPAVKVGGTDIAAEPAHLVPAPNAMGVWMRARGVVRLTTDSTGALTVDLVDRPDPFDPLAPVGTVLTAWLDPQHALIGQTSFGLGVGAIVWDASTTITPAPIEAAHHDASWTGLYFRELSAYLPVFGDSTRVTFGITDLILGDPLGLQGRASLSIGNDPGISGIGIDFYRWHDGNKPGEPEPAPVNSVIEISETGDWFSIEISKSAVDVGDGYEFEWTLKKFDMIAPVINATGLTTGDFRVDPAEDASLELQIWRMVDGQRVDLGKRVFTFALVEHLTISMNIAGALTVPDVASLIVDPQTLSTLTFNVEPPLTQKEIADNQLPAWAIGSMRRGSQARFTVPPLPSATNITDITLQFRNETRRVRITPTLAANGPTLVIGHRDSKTARGEIIDGSGARQTIVATPADFDLALFERTGELHAMTAKTTLLTDKPPGTTLDIPRGALAAVPYVLGPAPAPQGADTFKWHFFYDSPLPLDGNLSRLDSFVKQHPTATKFVIIGTCDDIGSDEHNADLATSRAVALAGALAKSKELDAGGALRPIEFRGEQEKVKDIESVQPIAYTDGRFNFSGRRAVEEALKEKDLYTASQGQDDAIRHNIGKRPEWRSATLYPIYVEPGGVPVAPSTPGRSVLVFVPGPAGKPEAPKSTSMSRVDISALWDSPVVRNVGDWMPTKLELRLVRQLTKVSFLAEADPTYKTTGPDVLIFVVSIAFDERTGQNRYTISVSAPDSDLDGLAQSDSAILAGLLAMAAPLAAALDKNTLSAAGGATIAAIAAGFGAASGVFTTPSSTTLHAVTFSIDHDASDKFRLLVDYSVKLKIKIPDGPFTTTPMRVRYRNVGVMFDTKPSSTPSPSFDFANATLSVEDPGTWDVNNPLGRLLRIRRMRVGSGSLWIEIDFEIAADFGIFELSDVTLRIVFIDGKPSFVFRGFEARVDVPHVINGVVAFTIKDKVMGGTLRAQLPKLRLSVVGSVIVDTDPEGVPFVAVDLGAMVPAGIPLAGTPLSIYGFLGSLVINGERSRLTPAEQPDPVLRELEWFHKSPKDRYGRKRGQWVIGLGVIAGTSADKGFTFNATGTITIELPDPAVMIAVDATLFREPTLKPPVQRVQSVDGGIDVHGVALIVVDSSGLVIGIRGEGSIREFLTFKGTIGLYFPFPTTTPPPDAYSRIGADDYPQEGPEADYRRRGVPITASLLPLLLDFKVSTYLMVELRRLHQLGGSGLSFDGFSIGVGAEFHFDWSAGPFGVHLGASFRAGLGLRPISAGVEITVRGELDLGIASVAASGTVSLLYRNGDVVFKGKFCGSIRLFFFTLKGCVDIGPDALPTFKVEQADHPVLQVELVDRHATTTATAPESSDDGTPLEGARPTAWADTSPVITFAHAVSPMLGQNPQFVIANQLPAIPDLVEGTEHHRFRLDGLTLKRVDIAGAVLAGPLDAVWWWPSHRTAQEPATADEVARLALMSWAPHEWAKVVGGDSSGDKSGPVGSIAELCEPLAQLDPVCVSGADATTSNSLEFTLAPKTRPIGPFPRAFTVSAATAVDLADVAHLAASLGANVTAPIVVTAPLAGLRTAETQQCGVPVGSLGFDLQLSQPLATATIVLIIERPAAAVPVDARLAPGGEAELPAVLAIDPSGASSPLTVTDRQNLGSYERVVLEAPKGPIVRVAVEAWRGRVSLDSLCGVTHAAQKARDDAEAARIADQNNLDSNGTAGGGPGQRVLLEPGARYVIEIDVSSQDWTTRPGAGPEPKATDPWLAYSTRYFAFDIAQNGAVVPAPGAPLDESTFRPEFLRRYLLGIEPANSNTPMFPDDDVEVYYEVDYIQALLSKYGWTLSGEARRTDQRAGNVGPGGSPPLLVAQMGYQVGHLAHSLLGSVEQAIQRVPAPCIGGYKSPGVTIAAQLDLEVSAEYDVDFRAVRGAEAVVLASTHLRTSRYRNAQELLHALNLEPVQNPYPPFDVVIQTNVLPASLTPTLEDDEALDAALKALGLDPLPLPTEPTVTCMWTLGAAGPAICGVIIDSVEPLRRRSTVTTVTSTVADQLQFVALAVSGIELQPIASSRSWTRVIWAPQTPITIVGDGVLDATLNVRDGTVVTGARYLGATPLTHVVVTP